MENLIASLSVFWSQWLWPIIELVVGLGLVVFVHEMGHFLAAKAVGIKVETFALGFGPRLFGWKSGDTDYCIKALPLGGYIKMLGQEDFAPLEETKEIDPRSYNAKSVGARFLVISAGVIMNVVLAAVLFIIVCLVGKNFPAPIIGDVQPGFPAAEAKIRWQPEFPAASQPASATTSQASTAPTQPAVTVGIMPGDRILSIRGSSLLQRMLSSKVQRFTTLAIRAALADEDEKFHVTLERTIDGKTWIGKTDMGVKWRDNRFSFGLAPATDLTFQKLDGYLSQTPFEDGDVLLAVNGEPIKHSWDLKDVERALDGRDVKITVLRMGVKTDIRVLPGLTLHPGIVFLKDGTKLVGEVRRRGDSSTVQIVSPDGRERSAASADIAGGSRDALDILGMIPRVKVTAVDIGSPAEAAGLRPGDIVLDYGDRGAPTADQLRRINEEVANKGTNIIVQRDGKTQPPMWIVPRFKRDVPLVGILQDVDLTHAVLADVRAGSPADKAGLQRGDVLETINGRRVDTWIDVYRVLRDLAGQDIVVAYNRGAQTRTANLGKLTEAVFDPRDYQFTLFTGVVGFRPLEVKIVKNNPVDAVVWGGGETWEFIMATYGTVRGLLKGSVSPKEVAGPVGVSNMAIQVGRESFVGLMYFMAFLSATIAVFNFLPLPVVDGGHAVFLLIEKLRGKPLPVKVMNAVQAIGLILLGLLFLAVTWQDIARLIKNAW
jgi:regulator of sigma E protease